MFLRAGTNLLGVLTFAQHYNNANQGSHSSPGKPGVQLPAMHKSKTLEGKVNNIEI